MGRVSKGEKCSVAGCGNEAKRSLSADKVRLAGLNVESGKRAYLCENHYKEFKRKTRKERKIERWRYKGV